MVIGNVRAAADPPHDLVQGQLVHILGHPVEHHQLGSIQLIHHQSPHIGIVGEERVGVGKQQFLIDHPFLRHGVKQRLQHPHTVIFDDDPLRPMLLLPSGKGLRRQLGRLLHRFNKHVFAGIFGGLQLHLALLAQHQQGMLPGIEFLILQRFPD